MTSRDALRLSIAATMALSELAHAQVGLLPQPAAGSWGEVVVFREASLLAAVTPASISAGGITFALLENAQRVHARLIAGPRTVTAQAGNGEPSHLQVVVPASGAVCIRVRAGLPNLLGVINPFSVFRNRARFDLEAVTCPQEPEMTAYKEVPVGYEPSVLGAAGQDAATLRIFRPRSGVLSEGPGNEYLYVDGVKSGRLNSNEAVEIKLSPGPHEIEVRIEVVGGFDGGRVSNISLDARAGEDLYVRYVHQIEEIHIIGLYVDAKWLKGLEIVDKAEWDSRR